MGKKIEANIYHLIVVLVISEVLVKSYAATDLTSDFTSTVDDQYPWSALAQRKGPTVQDTLKWKWTATDRSEKGPIDRFLHGGLSKSTGMRDEHSSSGQKVEDQGPGSIEIYQLTNLDSNDFNTIPLPPWNNLLPEKIIKNKSPKEIYPEYKKPHKPGLKKKIPPVRETQKTHKDRMESDSQGVPELQIGCEGLEAPIEPSSREPRSVSQNYSSFSSTPIDIPPVNPVTIDWNYNENDEPRHYEDMDELLKLKRLVKILNKEIKPRGDMRPDQDSDIDFSDEKKIPLRGDLVTSRKIRSILDNSPISKSKISSWRNPEGPWGFGENDGYISDNEEESTRRRTESERRREEYQRAQNEELERRRKEQLEQSERRRVEVSRRNDNQINSQIERIRKEYDMRLSQEQRNREMKLKEYIERNRPIVVENREGDDQRGLEEFMRRSGGNGYRDFGGRSRDRSRGPSPPTDGYTRVRDDEGRRREEEARRREEEARRRPEETRRRDEVRRRQEEQRRKEEDNRRIDEYRRQLEERQRASAHTSYHPQNVFEQRRREEENEKRRREFERSERRKVAQGRNDDLYRRLEEERRRNERIMEQKQRVPGVVSLDEVERRRWDERRLNSLPVSARIILVPGSTITSSTSRPSFGSRWGFDDDDGSTGINPNRPGLNAGRFPAAQTPKPPSNPPGACVWAVVQCCPNGDQRRLNSCFEYLGCPGVSWDPNPCRSALSDAARLQVAQYYASADETL